MIVRRAVLVAFVLAAGTTAAAAQSRRYPATVVDPDDAGEHESGFWARVADPGRAHYDQRVKDALLIARSDPRGAIAQLRATAEARPELVDAWGYVGLINDQLRDFGGCADGYGHAVAIDPRWLPDAKHKFISTVGFALSGNRQQSLTLAHAVCSSRASDVAGTIRALEAVIARGDALPGSSWKGNELVELWLRLGEAYLAAGRLDDAAGALGEAVIASSRRDPDAAWLLALAHDRARRTSLAEDSAAAAQRIDPNATNATRDNRPPSILPGDREYLRGLAAMTTPPREPPEPARPERALIYFRQYLAEAPADSPWRARAVEHVQALATTDLATRVESTAGSRDRAEIERAVRARMPALRACMAAAPTSLVSLRITALGPPAAPARPAPPPPPPPPPRRNPLGGPLVRPPVRPPALERSGCADAEQPGISATVDVSTAGLADGPIEDVLACVEKVGAGLILPRPPAGACATVRIPIASP